MIQLPDLDFEWILKHTNDVKNIVAAVISEETQDDLEELKNTIDHAIDVVFDILREPLMVKGIELERTRGMVDPYIMEKVINRIAHQQSIIIE